MSAVVESVATHVDDSVTSFSARKKSLVIINLAHTKPCLFEGVRKEVSLFFPLLLPSLLGAERVLSLAQFGGFF